MDKKIRKAVRTFLIRDNKIVVINYKNHDNNFYDIPGGKIENNETPEETSIREFKEETGITIIKQHYIGHSIIEYPDRIYDFNVYIVDDYYGKPKEFDENKSMWLNIDDLYKETKVLPSIEILRHLKENMDLYIECEINHNIMKIEEK